MPFLTRCGGTMVLIGVPVKDALAFNFPQIIYKEINIKTVMRYRNVYPVAINALSSGNILQTYIKTFKYK
jgi:L-iditol 2-dehydrogenase